jgi:hypothetical protein
MMKSRSLFRKGKFLAFWIEVILRPEYASVVEYRELFAFIGEVHNLTPQHLVILCHRKFTPRALDLIVSLIGLDKLDDLRIQTPSLEDVYQEFGGGNLDQ